MTLNNILKEFDIEDSVSRYGNGHINDTYLVSGKRYILQRINTGIFKNPDRLMENIVSVTEFLKEKIKISGGDSERETLTVIKTKDGENFLKCEDGYYRLYPFIEGSRTIEKISSSRDLYYAGLGFGRFGKMLGDFTSERLYETIPDFHNTPKRVSALRAAIERDKSGRAKLCRAEAKAYLAAEKIAFSVTAEIEKGTVPLRVTHNDTKINNILFDETSGNPLCVIDLDTVMPGSALYDFGDALRVGAATAAEDEKDLSKVHFSKEAFGAFTKGYFEEMLPYLTEREIELLPLSAKLLTFECGIRFLTDYLNGDTYFKIHREGHNLDRARTQFCLVRDIAKKEEELSKIVSAVSKEVLNKTAD